MKAIIAAMIVLAPTMAAAGPLSKFDNNRAAVLTSARSLSDVERCLIDLDNVDAPHVYRQPDRPKSSQILWTNQYGGAVARADLEDQAGGTRIKIWGLEKQARSCATTN